MIKIGITHGDINGTAYEHILRTFEAEDMLTLCTPVIYGSPKVAAFHRKSLGLPTNFIVRNNIREVRDHSVNMINCFGEAELKISLGSATEEKDHIARTAITQAIDDLSNDNIDALVTAPCTFTDGSSQTAYILSQLPEHNAPTPMTLLLSDRLCIATVTENIPLQKVSASITSELLTSKIRMLRTTLQRDFLIENPRIAVLALNPTSGDGSFAGSEEQDIIAPVVKQLFDESHMLCFGPYSADYIFSDNNYQHFDAILTMYSDQATAPFQALAQGEGIRYTAGLPFVVTTPAHDAQYEQAGKGTASGQAFRSALYTAIDACRHRRQYDSARSHPLQKQFYDRRDDSDKLRLDQVTDDEPEVTMI